jgi:HSP20 family protein
MAIESKHEVAVKKGTSVQKTVPRRFAFDEMERLFERMLPRGWTRPLGLDWPHMGEMAEGWDYRAPAMDVIDSEDKVILRAAVPGVDKKDLEVSVNDTSVAIKGKVMREAMAEGAEYYRCELGIGDFTRSVELPCAVDGSKARAHLKDGILELVLPKVEAAKRHAIKID